MPDSKSKTLEALNLIQALNLVQALGSIRALGEGTTTFLRALEDVAIVGKCESTVEAIDREIDAQPDTYIMRLFKVAVRLHHEGKGDPRSITLDAQAVYQERKQPVNLSLN